VAQEVGGRSRAAKVDIFDQQISRDDCFFAGSDLKDCGIVSDADYRGNCGAFSQRLNEIKFAALHPLELTTQRLEAGFDRLN
jgi:hypothetical protein